MFVREYPLYGMKRIYVSKLANEYTRFIKTDAYKKMTDELGYELKIRNYFGDDLDVRVSAWASGDLNTDTWSLPFYISIFVFYVIVCLLTVNMYVIKQAVS